MLRVVHISSPHRIIMNVFYLLNKHLFVLNGLWVEAFLPYLVSLVTLMAAFKMSKLFQIKSWPAFTQSIDDSSGSKRLEFSHLA